jgi:hypothetical protein
MRSGAKMFARGPKCLNETLVVGVPASVVHMLIASCGSALLSIRGKASPTYSTSYFTLLDQWRLISYIFSQNIELSNVSVYVCVN